VFGINTLSCREGRMEGRREGRECERRREGRGRHLLLLRNYNKERKTVLWKGDRQTSIGAK